MKTALVIFGISGDLSRRKLLPSLAKIYATGEFDNVDIIGVSRRDIDISSISPETIVDRISLVTLDMAHVEEYRRLVEAVAAYDQVIVYLSVPPLAVNPIVSALGKSGLNDARTKIMLEKPFGVDEASAAETLALTAQYFGEAQTYRIDHYLAKEMAQNVVMFRSANALFHRLWNREAIECVTVVATETLGVESRGEFYEQTGALRDVVQGHLMQLLSLVLIDIPDEIDWANVPHLRANALASLRAADPSESFRAQYDGYDKEVDNVGSLTETFAAVTLWSNDPTWQGVPLRLVTGKALAAKTTEIHVRFKKTRTSQANQLIFRIQPDEGVQIDLFVKAPGYDQRVDLRSLTYAYPEDEELPDAYEQVLVDAVRSQRNLFASSEEVAASWRVLQPLLDAWSMDNRPLPTYQVGAPLDSVLSWPTMRDAK